MELERFWINQPSTLQPDHALNGTRVLARKGYDGDRKDDKITRVYLLDGPVHSVNVFTSALSPGWPSKTLVRLSMPKEAAERIMAGVERGDPEALKFMEDNDIVSIRRVV